MSLMVALEAEIRRALSADAEVTQKLGSPPRIVEGETARAAYPFIRIFRHEARPSAPEGVSAMEHRISLEVFSRSGGRSEAAQLLAVVSDVLRRETLAPTGMRLILLHPVFQDVFLRADGTTYRGLLRLRALTELA